MPAAKKVNRSQTTAHFILAGCASSARHYHLLLPTNGPTMKFFQRVRVSMYAIVALVTLKQFLTTRSFRTFVLENDDGQPVYRKGETHVRGGNPVTIPDNDDDSNDSSFVPLLDQPFYVYEELLWLDGTYQQLSKVTNLVQEADFWSQYSEDLWFALAALRHPMRTMDPSEAKLFVVPILTHLVVNPVARSFCWNGMCNIDLLQYADKFLQQSPWFNRHGGTDHILVGTHPEAARLAGYNSFHHCQIIALENQKWNSPERYALPSLRWADSCSSNVSNKTTDVVYVGEHHTISKQSFWAPLGISSKMLTLAECHDLSKARLGLYLRENPALWGDAQPLSMILNYVVPVFTSKAQYKALPDWIDWDSLSYFVDASQDATNFLNQIKAIANDEVTYQEKLEAIQKNHDLVNWRTIVPFDTYMRIVSKKLGNRLAAKASPYPALKLPLVASQAFNISSKDTWCGGSGYHTSCGACPMDFGDVPSAGCGGNCRWCEYGLASNPLQSSLFQEGDPSRCFEQSLACHEPDLEAIVTDLARPAQAWQGAPLGFCIKGECTSGDCTKGILLAKTFKTGSTTAAAVSIHIADRVATRTGLNATRCQYAVHHKFSRENVAKQRDPRSSVLWSSVRDPGPRALSAYYFYRVGHKQVENTDEKAIKFLSLVKNHQFVQLRTQRGTSADGCCHTTHQIQEDSNQLYARIMREEILPLYDFIAVTERMDESLVALKMLWGLQTGDIIVSAAKAGQYSYNWNPKGTCFKIPRTIKREAVLDYISTDFHRANGDFMLHSVMNRSLDLTIDQLGREKFNMELEKYHKLKALTTQLCQNNATFPCSKTGEWQSGFEESCYEYDVGCGYRCIDSVLDRYESGELSIE